MFIYCIYIYHVFIYLFIFSDIATIEDTKKKEFRQLTQVIKVGTYSKYLLFDFWSKCENPTYVPVY